MALISLAPATTPPTPTNLTGPGTHPDQLWGKLYKITLNALKKNLSVSHMLDVLKAKHSCSGT